jgi:cytochrome bd ubiquinol oxidase subunit I
MSYDPAFWSRVQFAFTLTYHYLFPQLTMGLVWFLVYWKWRALRTGNEKYNQAVRFWAKIFGLNFAVGVLTGIPMKFQFRTNWADYSWYAGCVIGQTLAPENSLTAYAVASSPRALLLASVWWPVGFALATAYFVFISRRYAGKVSVKRDTQGFY